MLVNAPYIDEEYWKVNKKRLIEVFIKKLEQVIPDLSSHIIFKDAATPPTLYRWTRNYKGAAYGWAGIPSQLAVTGFTQKTGIDNLYLTGHWITLVQGIGGVAYLGCDTSKNILNEITNSMNLFAMSWLITGNNLFGYYHFWFYYMEKQNYIAYGFSLI